MLYQLSYAHHRCQMAADCLVYRIFVQVRKSCVTNSWLCFSLDPKSFTSSASSRAFWAGCRGVEGHIRDGVCGSVGPYFITSLPSSIMRGLCRGVGGENLGGGMRLDLFGCFLG